MSIKETIQNIGKKSKESKEKFKEMEEYEHFQELIKERRKSANLRELERYNREDNEKLIKDELEKARKKRQYGVEFEHNPINTPNIMKAHWHIMKEKNMFANENNIFANQKKLFVNQKNIFSGKNKPIKIRK